MIKDIKIKSMNLVMRNAIRIHTKSKDKYIFEVFDDSDNEKYTCTMQMGKGVYYWTCDCKNSTIHGNNSWCCHKDASNRLLDIDIFKLK